MKSLKNAEGSKKLKHKVEIIHGEHFTGTTGQPQSLSKPKTDREIADEMLAKYKVNLKPKGDRIIILPMPMEEKTAGGIFIPDTAKERPLKGVVVAKGPGSEDHPVEVVVGEIIIFGKYSGSEYIFRGQEYLIMRNSDVQCEVIELPD